MKKLLLGTVALILSAVVFGQDTRTVAQNGSDSLQGTVQLGDNTSSMDQHALNDDLSARGNENIASVLQLGSNTSSISSLGDRNLADVAQFGTGNVADIDQGVGYAKDNVAGTFQIGNGNTAMQKQPYENDWANINQNTNRNRATQDQSVLANQRAGNIADIDQGEF